MSTDDAGETTANDLGGADDLLSPMEATDADDVRNVDGDEVVDPPDDWSGADRFGMSAEEQLQGESLDQRLAEEVPDVTDGTAAGTDPDTAEEPLGSDAAAEVPGVLHGQIDGAPEDGASLFPVVE